MNILATEILDFWFSEKINPYWFNSTPEIDQEISQKKLSNEKLTLNRHF